MVLPNFPRTTSWLSEEERELAIWRLEEDIGADDWISSKDQSFWHGFKLAFSDVKVYILIFLLFGFVSAGSVTNFFPTVVKTLKYGNIETLLLTAPPYVLACLTCLANTWHADRTGERYLHAVLPTGFGIFAFILATATTSTAPRYVAMMFMPMGVYRYGANLCSFTIVETDELLADMLLRWLGYRIPFRDHQQREQQHLQQSMQFQTPRRFIPRSYTRRTTVHDMVSGLSADALSTLTISYSGGYGTELWNACTFCDYGYDSSSRLEKIEQETGAR